MSEKAVIDHFDDDWAVLLLGEAGDRQVCILREELPPGAQAGDWLEVEMDGDRPVACRIDAEATARARERIEGKVERLREKKKDEDQ